MTRFRVTLILDGRKDRRYRDTITGARRKAAAFREAHPEATVLIETLESDGKTWSLLHPDTGSRSLAPRRPANELPARVEDPVQNHTRIQRDWYWEGNVQDRFCKWLEAEGWTIVCAADTAGKMRGTDVVAERGCTRLLAEVKGFPSTTYADPRRAGEKKRTKPRLQARHWFAHALLKAAQLREVNRDAVVAIVLPDMDRYRELLESAASSLRKLGFRVFLVRESGAILEW